MGQGSQKKTSELLTSEVITTQKNLNSAMEELADNLLSFEQSVLKNNTNAIKRAEFLDRIFHANLGRMTTGLSPAALVIAYTDWCAHIAISPNKRLQLLESAGKKITDFWKNITDYVYKKELQCFETKDKRFNQRFKDDSWKAWPYCAIAQSFLQMEDWWQEATDIRGLEKNHKDLVSFVRYQWINALSPENSPFLNPQVLEKTIETKGQNLVDGWRNFQNDVWRYLKGERAIGTEHYVVGKDVAVTKGKIVYRNELFELIQYAPQTKQVYSEPVLIIPAWIMKYYILDLSPHNSMVNYLVKKGHTVFMMSWKNPDERYRDYGMQDYLKKGVIEALDAVTAITQQKKIHATGYCIGGTILTMAASYLVRHHDHRLKTITLFAAQTDFEEAGELMTFIDENQLCYLEDIMFSQGYLRGDQMSSTFDMLRPRQLIWSKAVQQYLLGERQSMNDLMAWNEDVTRLPYKMHAEYLRHLHLNNDLAEGDYRIDGEPVTLEDIQTPLFVVATEKDHIAPWKSVYKIHLYPERAEVTFVLANRGHNGGIVSEPGHKGRSYRMGKTPPDSPYKTPDDWYQHHKSRPGSWWAAWHRWLAEQSGSKSAPPSMGAPERGYNILEEAPGVYVKER
ncbi:PHA/PHB synthase family protein [Legionella oakridgensis]|uniref:Poly3-hydroxyalkanoate synthetase n=3 Tax=Legionella oakridgensis TaxID=29423 RepID=W0BCZ9_9GAMM|nr:alpha/beta fold hydrolase [Legionella oakridgensis]AHE66264.1 poly3-hydroxyalkanoate synthetase [Legionella oakridgensis ATCC 33761 = DSM 21215]ETO93905.1 poly(3-hydroxyalkanoate) synthetase [Legionella oakridgensis RV-2-2007]KTD37209.1 polyhydroxyalkanoic synthase [Legionella oakridgensis]STY16161.1 putative Poly-beta-hydroxybutyrate polymerase [Legionella longbeachae]